MRRADATWDSAADAKLRQVKGKAWQAEARVEPTCIAIQYAHYSKQEVDGASKIKIYKIPLRDTDAFRATRPKTVKILPDMTATQAIFVEGRQCRPLSTFTSRTFSQNHALMWTSAERIYPILS